MSDLMERLKIEWKIETEENIYKNITKLFSILLKNNRAEDLHRCMTDPVYLKLLADELVSKNENQ